MYMRFVAHYILTYGQRKLMENNMAQCGTELLSEALEQYCAAEGLPFACAHELAMSDLTDNAQMNKLVAFGEIWDQVTCYEDNGAMEMGVKHAKDGLRDWKES